VDGITTTHDCDQYGHNCHDTTFEFGAHLPVGLDMLFTSVPIELFLEVAPGLRILPFVDFAVFGGFGARYFF